MKYTKDEIAQYVEERDVKFIRMAFCDIYGKQKNISVMPTELDRAFTDGIAVDASAIPGFGGRVRSDLFLHPDSSTLSVLPWRPEHGRVIRMFCSVTHPDGSPCPEDVRSLLIRTADEARKKGYAFSFGTEIEFYLFRLDDEGEPTKIPYDRAGYMDIAPDDKGENVRREICLTLEQMGITPESSHHEEGPGQNEIDFRYADPITTADNAVTFRAVVDTIAARSGLHADFSPKPLADTAGNGMHINLSVTADDGKDRTEEMIAGILSHISEITAFLNPTESSYLRLGNHKAPRYISFSRENRSQLIRIPAATGAFRRVELRSPDPTCNPYLALTLLIRAAMDGIERHLMPPPPVEMNFFDAPASVLDSYASLPKTLPEARALAAASDFVSSVLPKEIIDAYIG